MVQDTLAHDGIKKEWSSLSDREKGAEQPPGSYLEFCVYFDVPEEDFATLEAFVTDQVCA